MRKQNWSRWFHFCQRSSGPRGTGTEAMHWRYLGRDAVHRKDYIDQCQSQHHQEERRHLQWVVDPWDSKIGMGDTPNGKAACWRKSSLSSSTRNLPCGSLWPFLEPSGNCIRSGQGSREGFGEVRKRVRSRLDNSDKGSRRPADRKVLKLLLWTLPGTSLGTLPGTSLAEIP